MQEQARKNFSRMKFFFSVFMSIWRVKNNLKSTYIYQLLIQMLKHYKEFNAKVEKKTNLFSFCFSAQLFLEVAYPGKVTKFFPGKVGTCPQIWCEKWGQLQLSIFKTFLYCNWLLYIVFYKSRENMLQSCDNFNEIY